MKILFSILFLISLLVFEFSGFEDWLIINLMIQVIWLILISNIILNNYYSNYIWANRIRNFNKITLVILVLDLIIIFLSVSFFVRILLAPFYYGMFVITSIFIFLSIIINYSILIKCVMQLPKSIIEKTALVLASFFYPIGIFLINIKGYNKRYFKL